MSISKYKIHILGITGNSGNKSVDLIMNVMRIIGPGTFDREIYDKALEELVIENKLMEIEYSIPSMANRRNSFYLPAGTSLRIK
jgi:hypothetical protein